MADFDSINSSGISGSGGEARTRWRPAQSVALFVKSAVRAAGDVLVPPVCLACHAPLCDHNALCASCWSQIDFIRPPVCDCLGLPLPYDSGGVTISAGALADPPPYDRARAVAVYHGTLQKLIHGFKYSDRHDARRLFGRWLVSAGAPLLGSCDVIVPVPLNRWRLLSRRFNQAAILGLEVSRASGLPFAPLALERRRVTRPQVGLSREERRANLHQAFAVPERARPSLAGKRVLLIDDVITTGATVRAAAKCLKAAGVAGVDVLALALVTDGGPG